MTTVRQNAMGSWRQSATLIIFTGWLALSIATSLAASLPTERIPWQKAPIELTLRIGEERLVHFPASVKVGVPAQLQSVLRTQSVAGTLYLRANQPFGATRIVVREIEGGRIYLLDLKSTEEALELAPIRIFLPEALKVNDRRDGQPQAPTPTDYGYVTLTRFAALQLYAPMRLVSPLPGVVQVPVRREAVPLVRGGSVAARPLIAWRAGVLYVTAVKLTNQANSAQILDPRNLRGSWLAATFQHNRLLALSDEADTTTLYLISARPFAASL